MALPVPILLGMGWFPDQEGGLNRYFRDLLHGLSADGLAARSVVLGPVSDPTFPGFAAANRGESFLSRIRLYARACRTASRNVDVVDAHFAPYALLPVRLGALRHLPLVIHFQGPWADESASVGAPRRVVAVKRRVERSVYRRADRLIVLSSPFKRILVERYGVVPWKIRVIPPGVDLEHFCPGPSESFRDKLGIRPDASVVLAVRRLVPRMGLDVLLRAWALLSPGNPGAVLLVAGAGPERAVLEGLAVELGIAGRVRFLGKISEEDLLSSYRLADLCVVPSMELEGFGLVVLEALACGTPVVATDVGGLPEALSGLDSRLVVPRGDSAALALVMGRALDGRQGLPTRAACRAYAEGFSWKVATARNVEVYSQTRQVESSTKLRVVYLDHFAGLSGGELALSRLLPALPGIEAHVMLAEDGPLIRVLADQGASVEVFPMAAGARGLRRDRVSPKRLPIRAVLESATYVFRLARRLRRLAPDIVHTNSLKSALYGGIAGRLAGVPVVWHIRDRIAPDYLPRAAVRLVHAMATRIPRTIIANSRTTLETIPLGRTPGVVVPSPLRTGGGPRLPRNRKGSASSSAPGLRVAMVGRLAPWKGQHIFLQAFAQAFPDVAGQPNLFRASLMGAPLFGEADYQLRLKQLVETLGLEGRVEFCGMVDDVEERLGHFDVLVHASVIAEPFGNVVVEGMAAGLAVIAAAAGGPAEIVSHGENGLLCPPNDVDSLAAALQSLATDPALRERLARAGTLKAREFAPDVVGKQVMEVYRSLLSSKRVLLP